MSIQISDEAKTRYLLRRHKDLDDCKAALQNKDFRFLQNIGHQLKGNAVTFGHPALGELGAHIEQSAKDQDSSQLEQCLKNFEDYLAAIS